MSFNKYKVNDIERFSERLKRLEQLIYGLKAESKVEYSSGVRILDSGINHDGEIITPSLTVATGKKVIYQFAFDSLYKDYDTTEYSQGANSSYLTADSTYLTWLVIGINNGTWYDYELSWTAGNKRIYETKSEFDAGSYLNLKLYAKGGTTKLNT